MFAQEKETDYFSTPQFTADAHNSEAGCDQVYAYIKVFDKTPVFDLDFVLLDATHRMRVCDKTGALDLEHYILNSTPIQIMKDKSLPLINLIKRLNSEGIHYYVCTARIICKVNRLLLTSHEITPLDILHRHEENAMPDSQLKAHLLTTKFSHDALRNMVLIDDKKENCAAAVDCGLSAIHVKNKEEK